MLVLALESLGGEESFTAYANVTLRIADPELAFPPTPLPLALPISYPLGVVVVVTTAASKD